MVFAIAMTVVVEQARLLAGMFTLTKIKLVLLRVRFKSEKYQLNRLKHGGFVRSVERPSFGQAIGVQKISGWQLES
jgi:hypothetical protein